MIAARIGASMGPRSVERGNTGDKFRAIDYFPLQWGRALSSAETGGLLLALFAAGALQWGRALSSAETK